PILFSEVVRESQKAEKRLRKLIKAFISKL
ncbi:MAG: purine-nucleoside phosphorylase, partial [Thermodesulfobacteriota bacterium]